MELPKAYDPKQSEKSVYDKWLASGYFNPDKLRGKRKEPFSIAMPPFNVTGILHIGHAVLLALQDIMIRFERMRGKKALWVPGTDHASIATQNIVEQELRQEGKTKHDLGRHAFLQRVEEFVAAKQGRIREQVSHMGASCDWSRERFTLDEGLSTAVRTAFTKLYEDGLIYRGTRVVNWCPHCQSTLADDEVDYQEKNTKLYTFRYSKDFPISIATTRPETKFGDTAVAVHPEDPRYKEFLRKTYDIDFAGLPRTIRVVGEWMVDKEFGTGALGVTPAHSATDERVARNEKLPFIQVINERGRMTNEAGPDYADLLVRDARKKLVARLREDGLLESEQDIRHNLSVCYRCGTPVEPLPSKQWFVAVDKATKRLKGKSLKQRALEVVEKKEVAFVPDRFANVYRQWMENLHDWCISRQIWYGHQIPVWYKDDHIHVGDAPKGGGWTQDTDTLDTWFSSALWTFSTLGWPEKTKDLKFFHPTSVMETAYDIIFFWVARMILMSTYLLGEIPFRTVYLHGLVRDKQGRKLSKSLGNGIDPLEMSNKYGADAVRLSLVIGTTPGNDQRLDEQKIAGYRNYINKVWNIGRFIALQSEGKTLDQPEASSLADKWILHQLNQLIQLTTSRLERFEFSAAGEAIYDFIWHEFADWYLEITKVEGNVAFARDVFGTALRLLHPFMPFVTETLWSQGDYGKDLLVVADWPAADESKVDGKIEEEFNALRDKIIALRKQRLERKIAAGQPLEVRIGPDDPLWRHQAVVERLGKVKLSKTSP